MTTRISLLGLVLLAIAACAKPAPEPRIDNAPLLRHLGDTVALAAIGEHDKESLLTKLDALVENGASAEQLKTVLDAVRAAALIPVADLPNVEQLEAEDEKRMFSLVDVLNLSFAIAKANQVELAVSQAEPKRGYKCDRVGSGGQCWVRSPRNKAWS